MGSVAVVGVWQVNSHARVAVWTAYCGLAASMRLPCQFGWTPSALKRMERFQNRLKLSMKLMLRVEQVDRNQVLRLRILLKPSAPRAMVGIGPEIKTVFPQLAKKFKRSLKSRFVCSDCLLEVSQVPT